MVVDTVAGLIWKHLSLKETLLNCDVKNRSAKQSQRTIEMCHQHRNILNWAPLPEVEIVLVSSSRV